MKHTLYELHREGIEIADVLDATDGELTPELEERLDALLSSGKDKLEAAAKVVRLLEANAETARLEAQRLRERCQSYTRQADRLKGRMLGVLDTVYGGKTTTPLFTLWGQTSVPRCDIGLLDDKALDYLPTSFVIVERRLNKAALLEEHKHGRPLPEGVTVTDTPGTHYLRIK